MFKTLSSSALLGLLTLSAAHAQSEQPLHATIPFAFTVQDTTLAPGIYQLTYNHTAQILSIRSLGRNGDAAFTRALPGAGAQRTGRLVFNCYGNTCYLAGASQGGYVPGLRLLPDRRDGKLPTLIRVVPATLAGK